MESEQAAETDLKSERIRLLMEQSGLDPDLINALPGGKLASPAALKQVARTSEIQAGSLADMVETHRESGNVLEAELAQAELDFQVAQADLLNSLAAEIPHITEDSSLAALGAKFDTFAGALDTRGTLNQQADVQRRQYLGTTIAIEIGPELESRGFTPEETAITVKAITDNLVELTPAANSSNVAMLDDLAREAVDNFKNSRFSYPQNASLDASQQKIHTAVYAARGCTLEMEADGKPQITTQNGDPVYDLEMNESIAAASSHVAEHGAESVVGDEALSQGRAVQENLRERSQALAAEVAAAPAVEAPAAQETPSRRSSVREMLGEAANRVSVTASSLKTAVTDKVDQFKLDRLDKQIDKRGSHLDNLLAARKGLNVPADRAQRDQEIKDLQAQYQPTVMDPKKQIDMADRIELLKTANKLDDRIQKNIEKIDGLKEKKQAQAEKMELRAHRHENATRQGPSAAAKVG